MSGAVSWRIWREAARPRTLPAAVAPVLVGSGLAWHERAFQPLPALICLVFALLIQIGTNYANDYYDFMRGADAADRVGPRRVVGAGLIAPAAMKRAMWRVFAAAFLLGLTLVAWGGWWLIAIGLASILCGIAYTGGPYPLAYHGLGDVFVFLFFGLIAVGATFYVQAGRVNLDALLAAVPVGLLAANILLVNNYRDAETDARAGKRTLIVRWGKTAAQWQHAVALAVALFVPVLLLARGERLWVLLPWALAPLAFTHAFRLARAQSPAALIALLGDTGKFLAAYGLLFAAGLALG